MTFATIVFFGAWASGDDSANLTHSRYKIKHGMPLEVEKPTPERFTTTRTSNVELMLPNEEPSFSFMIFGDRVAGKPEGINILAEAVYETNLIGPDFVINVGDMVQGYNETDEWLKQMSEFRSVMAELKTPWFPVPGNHDLYWRKSKDTPDENAVRPTREHETEFERYFGPLWYAFEHKNCWFIVLCTDEGDPETGKKDFRDPKSQKMSDAQFTWLKETLQKAKNAEHVFVFQHQPRWMGGENYGDDWNRVHQLLVEAGNVSAVFAGHIHRLRYDLKDGIEYIVLATTGGNLNEEYVGNAGFIHHVNLVTVRKEQFSVAGIPVDTTFDPRNFSQKTQREIQALQKAEYVVTTERKTSDAGTSEMLVTIPMHNTASQPIVVTAMFELENTGLTCEKPKKSLRIEPGQKESITFDLSGDAEPCDKPRIKLTTDYYVNEAPIRLPEKNVSIAP